MHLYSYHKIYISVWHGALGRAGRGVEEQSKALRSGVPGEGHPRSGPARLPWVPSTPPLTWVPCGLPHLSPGLDLSPLKSGLCPAVVPSSAARGGLGLGGGGGDGEVDVMVWERGPPLAACSETHRRARVAGGIGAGEPCPRHPCHNSAGAQPCRCLFLPGEVGGGGGSPGPPGSPGHPVPLSQPSAVSAALAWTYATI